MGRRHPRGSRSYDCDLAPPWLDARRGGARMDGEMAGIAVALGHPVLAEAVLGVGSNGLDTVALGDVPLQRSNGDGSVDRSTPACVLAGCGADAAADRGERVRGPGDEIGVFLAPFGDELDVASRVGGHWAARLALDLGLPVLEIGEACLDPAHALMLGRRERRRYDRRHEIALIRERPLNRVLSTVRPGAMPMPRLIRSVTLVLGHLPQGSRLNSRPVRNSCAAPEA